MHETSCSWGHPKYFALPSSCPSSPCFQNRSELVWGTPLSSITPSDLGFSEAESFTSSHLNSSSCGTQELGITNRVSHPVWFPSPSCMPGCWHWCLSEHGVSYLGKINKQKTDLAKKDNCFLLGKLLCWLLAGSGGWEYSSGPGGAIFTWGEGAYDSTDQSKFEMAW